MKLSPQILKLALHEAHHHLLSDLYFSETLHGFFKNNIDEKTYLSSEFGFKKFLNDYGVGRTLKAGDDAKLKILRLIQKYPFENNHVNNITSLSNAIKRKNLSSNSSSGEPGLPQSFCSKLLYVFRPDEIIPYDSYVLKSLQIRIGQPIKTLEQYYAEADHFRQSHFYETSKEILKMLDNMDKKLHSRFSALEIDPVKMLSWKLTDKYLWCEEYSRRKKE